MIYQPRWIKTEVDIHDFPSYKPFRIRTSIIYGARSRKIQFPSSRDSAQELRGHLSGFLTDVSPSRPIPVSSVGAPQAREKKNGAMGIGMGQIWDVRIETMVHDVNVGSTARSHPQVSTFWGPL